MIAPRPFGSAIADRAATLIVQGLERGFENALGDMYSEEARSPNFWVASERRLVRCVVWHVTDGGFTASRDWLCNPESECSATDLINRDGKVWNLVAGDNAPWTNGPLCDPSVVRLIPAQAQIRGVNPNWWSYTIENVATSAWGRSGSLSQAQIASLVLRTAQACHQYHLTPDPEHILRHSNFDSCTRSGCPGFSPKEMLDWIAAVRVVTRAWRGW